MTDPSRAHVLFAAIFLLGVCPVVGIPALQAQQTVAGPESDGELEVRVWTEGAASYTTATVSLSRTAYTAVFLVEEGAGATLLYPHGPRDAQRLGPGTYRFELSSARLAAHRRLRGSSLSRRSIHRASHRSHTYLLAIAAPTPLRISSLRSTRTLRSGVGARSALGLADDVMRRVVPDYHGTGWSYHLQPIIPDRLRTSALLYRPRTSHVCGSLLLFPGYTTFTTGPWFLADPWMTNLWWRCSGVVLFPPGPHSPRRHPQRPPIHDGGEGERFDPSSIRVGHPIPRNLPVVRPRDTGGDAGTVEEKSRVRPPTVEPPRARTPRVVPSRVQPPRVREPVEMPRAREPVNVRPRVQRPVKTPRVQKPKRVEPKKARGVKKAKPKPPPKSDGDGEDGTEG